MAFGGGIRALVRKAAVAKAMKARVLTKHTVKAKQAGRRAMVLSMAAQRAKKAQKAHMAAAFAQMVRRG